MEEKLFEYAKLVMEVGLNVQKGQTVIISSPVECAHFALPVRRRRLQLRLPGGGHELERRSSHPAEIPPGRQCGV